MDFCVKLANRTYDMTYGSYPFQADESGRQINLPPDLDNPLLDGKTSLKGWDTFKEQYDGNRRIRNAGIGLAAGGLLSTLGGIASGMQGSETLPTLLGGAGLAAAGIGGLAAAQGSSKMKPYGIKFLIKDEDKDNFYDILGLNDPEVEIPESVKSFVLDSRINEPIVTGKSEYYGQEM